MLLLNACESLAAVQMDTVPGYAEELLAIVPDRVDREVGACHYAVLHLCFGSGNKQAFSSSSSEFGGFVVGFGWL